MAVRKIFRFSFSRPWAWAWLVSLEIARGRPAVEKVSVEIRLAGAAQDVVQGDFVEEPDKFHHNDSCGQDGGAAQEGLLFLIRHEAITSNYNRELGRRNLLPL